MTDKETFLASADLIEKHGWIQGMNQSNKGFCVLGAINFVLHGDPRPLAQKLRNELDSRYPDHPHHIGVAEWNDTMCSSKEQAIGLLRSCAEKIS